MPESIASEETQAGNPYAYFHADGPDTTRRPPADLRSADLILVWLVVVLLVVVLPIALVCSLIGLFLFSFNFAGPPA